MYNTDREDEHMWSRRVSITQTERSSITCVHHRGLCYTYPPRSHVFIIAVCVILTLLDHMCSSSWSVLYIPSWITCVHPRGLSYTYPPRSHVFIIAVCVILTLLDHMCSSSWSVLYLPSSITCVHPHGLCYTYPPGSHEHVWSRSVSIKQTVRMNTCDPGGYV
jgi:hypothetical protein